MIDILKFPDLKDYIMNRQHQEATEPNHSINANLKTFNALTVPHMAICGQVNNPLVCIRTGLRCLDCVDKELPLSQNIPAFTIGILVLMDELEQINIERGYSRKHGIAWNNAHDNYNARQRGIPPPPKLNYVNRTRDRITWADYFSAAAGLPSGAPRLSNHNSPEVRQ
eukprot:14707573-Heterocapsa_arctica.AAC.1